MTEATLTRAILLRCGSLPNARLWQIKVCPVINPRTGERAGGLSAPVGHSDLIGIQGGSGKLVSLEIKTETGRLSTEQAAFGKMIQTFGGIWACVRSPEDALRVLGMP